MAKKPQYPNPKFFKAKDNIDWKKQGENLMTCVKIFAEMFKETDWNKFFEGQKNNAIAFADRVKEEYAAFMALDARRMLSSTVKDASAVCTARAQWQPFAVSGVVSRTPHMTSMSGLVCGSCS